MQGKWMPYVVSLALMCFAIFGAQPALAQDPSSPAPASGQDVNSAPPKDAVRSGADPDNTLSGGAPGQYIVLGTDRQVALDPLLKYQFIYGMDLTEGYDDGVILFPSKTGVYYTLWTPRVGIIGRTAKSQYIIQYTPTISHFNNAGNTGVQAYQEGTAEFHTEVNRGWGWDFTLNTQYGTYPLSLLSEFGFQSLDGIPAVNPNSILLLSSQDYFNTDASVGLHWRASPRDLITISTIYNYSNFRPNAVPGSVAGHLHRDDVTATYAHAVTRRFNILANGEELHVFGPFGCTTYGGQLGASYEVHRGTTISATAGPQFGSGVCSDSVVVSYSGHISSRLSRNWDGYLSAERTATSPIHSALGGGLTDTYGAGLARRFGERVDFRLDGGYIRVASLPGVPGSFSADGKYISPELGWKFSKAFELDFRYRKIYQSVTGQNLDRNQAMVTLEWRPYLRGSF
jgi:hypothetical protein